MKKERSTPKRKSEELATAVRIQCIQMTHRAQSSHIGSSLSVADILAVLYGEVMNFRPSEPAWSDRDRFILSKGHACAAVYATLAEVGYFKRDRLQSFGADHSEFMTHISHKVPGVEFSTGSLGHGIPFGLGKALAAKRLAKSWRTFVVTGDGEIAEGSNWEAALFAAHHRLDNLVVVVDYNNLQSLTTVEETLNLAPLSQKFSAFGWAVREVDGHSHSQLSAALATTPWTKGKPSLLIAKTIKGKGVSFMEDSVHWHYKSPNGEQAAQAIGELQGISHA